MTMLKAGWRRRWFRALVVVLVVLGFVAGVGYLWVRPSFAPLKALEGAEHVTLYSLSPGISEGDHLADMLVGNERMGGHEVRAKNEVSNHAIARQYCQLLHDAMKDANPEAMALCFNPRHGLRVHTPFGPVDYVICFECNTVMAGRRPLLGAYPLRPGSDDGTLDLRFITPINF